MREAERLNPERSSVLNKTRYCQSTPVFGLQMNVGLDVSRGQHIEMQIDGNPRDRHAEHGVRDDGSLSVRVLRPLPVRGLVIAIVKVTMSLYTLQNDRRGSRWLEMAA
jgi:hypothetical protein